MGGVKDKCDTCSDLKKHLSLTLQPGWSKLVSFKWLSCGLIYYFVYEMDSS